MNRVVKILMRRDGISQEDAQQLVDETREEILSVDMGITEADDILMSNLGLEPDYLLDIIS